MNKYKPRMTSFVSIEILFCVVPSTDIFKISHGADFHYIKADEKLHLWCLRRKKGVLKRETNFLISSLLKYTSRR